jgi:hypothetical protein
MTTYYILDNGRERPCTAAEVEDIVARQSTPKPPTVPEFVTMRQARLILFRVGMLEDVEAALEALPSPQKEAARIEWDYSSEVERHRGLVAALGESLGLTEPQLDDLFIKAAEL